MRRRVALRPRLIAISDTALAPVPLLARAFERLAELCTPGSLLVQLRDLELSDRARLELARTLREITAHYEQALAVNDRADFALLIEADCLHLGDAGISTPEARKLAPELLISRACHDPAQAGRLETDLVLVSPIFAARKARGALGLEGLRAACAAARQAVSPPLVYALGGIDAQNAASCLTAGAEGVAAIGALLDGRDPLLLVEALGIRREKGR